MLSRRQIWRRVNTNNYTINSIPVIIGTVTFLNKHVRFKIDKSINDIKYI